MKEVLIGVCRIRPGLWFTVSNVLEKFHIMYNRNSIIDEEILIYLTNAHVSATQESLSDGGFVLAFLVTLLQPTLHLILPGAVMEGRVDVMIYKIRQA